MLGTVVAICGSSILSRASSGRRGLRPIAMLWFHDAHRAPPRTKASR